MRDDDVVAAEPAMTDPAPILIFAYNRPDKLEGLMASLEVCPEYRSSPISIFIDGPKSELEYERVQQVLAVAKARAPKHAQIHAREENQGLRASIMQGVSQILSEQDCAIILEDDLDVSPNLLTYFNLALQKYRANDRVWSISAYMYDVPGLSRKADALFLPFANPWAWATWDTRWNAFASGKTNDHFPHDCQPFKANFDGLGVRDFTSIQRLNRQGLVSSWFMNWYLAMFNEGGLTLWPPRPLVSNQGVASGTHASALNIHRFLPRAPVDKEFMPELPSQVKIDYNAWDQIRRSRDVRLQRLVSILGGYKRRLKRWLGAN